jgi:hypothetical protein
MAAGGERLLANIVNSAHPLGTPRAERLALLIMRMDGYMCTGRSCCFGICRSSLAIVSR